MNTRSKAFYTYAVLVLAYSLITLLPAPAAITLHKYHLHPTGLRLLDFTLIIPTFVMWFAAFYGYEKLNRYGQLIKKNQDGVQVARLARGLFALAIGLPISSLVTSLLTLLALRHPGLTSFSVILPHFIDIAYMLIAFLFFSAGVRGLGSLSKSRPGVIMTHSIVFVVIVLGVVFCNLITWAHDRHTLLASFHMSYSLVMLTVAIPYMFIWFLGLSSIAETYAYSKRVTGIVYRKGWNRLAFGLGSIIVLDILLQYLGTLYTWLNGLSLTSVLALLYVLLFLLAGGFIVVALGTRDLMKIEEV